ncbi:putative prophage repressor [Salinisphaera sp. T31B1]
MVSLTGGASYPPGTLIFVDPEVRDMVTGALVLARLTETHEVTFKRLNIEGGEVFLEPINTQYPIIRIASGAQIIGTVKGAMISM